MNDFELESKLKSIPLPARTEEYWEHFPTCVRSQLRPVFAGRPQKAFPARLAWGSTIAFAGLIMTLALWPALQVTLKEAHAFRHELEQLPNHLRVLMVNEHGMHHLIADQQ